MSKAAVAKRKKKMSLDRLDKKTRSIAEKKLEPNAKATNSNVFDMGNWLTEDEDEKLEIFYQKGRRKSDLPSISELLASSNRDSEISLQMNSSIEKSQQPQVRKDPQNEDIFISKIAKSIVHNDEGMSSALSRNEKRIHDYSISDMFSDDLSPKDNFGGEFNSVSGPNNSHIDSLPPVLNTDAKIGGNISLNRKERENGKKKVVKNLGTSGPQVDSESFKWGSSQLRESFARSKWQKETLSSSKMRIGNSSQTNKELNTFSHKTGKSASSILLPSGKKELGIKSSHRSSIGMKNYDDNTVWEEENQKALPRHRIDKRREHCSTQDKLDLVITPEEIISDIDLDESESHSINITLSDCNLDHSINSEDFKDRSIEMIHKKAMWYMDEASGNTEMNHNEDENIQLTGLNLNFIKHNLVIGSKDAADTGQSDSQLSDPLIELIDNGSQFSDTSDISLTPNMPEFDLSPNFGVSFKERNPIGRQKSGHSGFDLSQSMYIKQSCPFFNRKKHENNITNIFKLYDSTATKNEQFKPKIDLPICPKQNYISVYESKDGNKENVRSILDPEEQSASHIDLGTVFTSLSPKKSASFNSVNRNLKRRYPFDGDSDCVNIEFPEGCDVCEEKKRVAKNVGVVKNRQLEKQNISVDYFSRSGFEGFDISGTNSPEPPSGHISKISKKVQAFVKEWLNRDDKIDSVISNRSMDRENISIKRRRIDVDNPGREKNIYIDPEMLLSNYSCEYNKSYAIQRFKPN